MTGRQQFVCAGILLTLSALSGRAQDPQSSAETFRSGIDLITVDVTVIDRQGRPVEDLRPGDFNVRVDGRPRDVVSAALVRVDRSVGPPPPAGPTERLVTSNVAEAGGRRIAIAVDQTLVLPGAITPLLETAARFVDGLTPQDRAAFVAFPEPGPRVEFTVDKTRVREAMQRIVGQVRKVRTASFDVSLTESFSIVDKERLFTDFSKQTPEEFWRTLGPMLRRVLERGCEGLTRDQLLTFENFDVLKQCVRDIVGESSVNQLEARTDANLSRRALEQILAELVPVEGSKSLVLFSAGLLTEDLTALDEVTRLAAAARTSITVIAVASEREQVILSLPNGQSSTAVQDRTLELQGLETIADRTGGSFVQAIAGNGEGIFDRLATELSAWYVVAVERQRGDPELQRVDVDVRRRGVAVRSNRTFVAAAAINAARPGDEVLREALSSPIAISGVPLRVSTFALRDAASGKHRLHVAAQIGRPGTPSGDFSVGFVVVDDTRNVVASLGRQVRLTPAAPDVPLHFDSALAVDPGAYSLRFGVVDAEGRRGTVVHPVDVETLTHADVATSDLIVGSVPSAGEAIHPSVEPHVGGGRVAGYLELYPEDAEPGALTVSLEIAEGEASPALTTRLLNISAGARAEWRVASGAVDAALLPGRYVARAKVARNGELVRVLARPFVLGRHGPLPTAPAERGATAAVSPEMLRRTAVYVGNVVGGLSNVVGREEFTLTNPDRRITSEWLLVRYPGSERDLLTYRDVVRVNGGDVADRPERLTALFLKPMVTIRDQVRQISLAAAEHVPPALNPIYVLAFLQPDFQSRFEFRVQDAGPEWPSQVRLVAFGEMARPTLLRAGPLGDLDVPSRGRAWIEEGTGRILQTELQVGTGRSPTTVVTRFTLDQRLQIMVPEMMRTVNPTGVATYSNFRRFRVETGTEINSEPSAPVQ